MDILESDFLRVCLTPYAAAVGAVFDKRTGKDLALRLGSEEAHLFDASYSGNTVGSYAGRIRNAGLRIGDDLWMLDRNDGASSIHGGFRSLRRIWDRLQADGAAVSYETRLKHLEDGLPGERRFSVTYRLDGDTLFVKYSAGSDRKTFFNITNHIYFSLDPDGDERNDLLRIDASRVVRNDEKHLPVEIVPVEGTLFDFRSGKRIGNLEDTVSLGFSRGLNNYFFLDGPVWIVNGELCVVVSSDAPGAVVYTGGFLEKPFSGIAVEPETLVPLSGAVDGVTRFERNISYRFIAPIGG